MDDRESRLPKWAQDQMANLRLRAQCQNESLIKELTTLRPKVALLKAENEAMKELLDCAARGNHKSAFEIMEIIRAYGLELVERND